jgi:hypothetical protein
MVAKKPNRFGADYMADEAPKFYLQWNLPNWITVGFMSFAMVIVVGFVASGIRAYRKTKVDD